MSIDFSFRVVRLKKLYPLAISRGVTTGSQNLFVFAADERGNIGLGECAPGTGFDDSLAPLAEAQLRSLIATDLDGLSIHEVWGRAHEAQVNPSAMAALDTALWDLKAKQAGLPLYSLLGLSNRSVPTSVTIGINPVDVILERVPEILQRTGAKALKIKLGCPDGVHRDQENYLAAAEATKPFGASLRVDANGGWDVPTAIMMDSWLAERGCDYIEQPLPKGAEDGLPELFAKRKLPLFADESCHFASNVVKLKDCVDGVNLKLMKCGGITEALRIIATARACGLQTMIGCMGESSCAIAAGVAIGELFDHIDLDSQLNLDPDPCAGLEMIDGVVTPRGVPGHGAYLVDDAL